jgi:hypothetical protein
MTAPSGILVKYFSEGNSWAEVVTYRQKKSHEAGIDINKVIRRISVYVPYEQSQKNGMESACQSV